MLNQLLNLIPHITIPKPDGKPYLTRFYLLLKDRTWGNSFLHHFHSSDMDVGKTGALLFHNHPFDWSVSLILFGGYVEERIDIDTGYVWRKTYKPFSINFIRNDAYHRVSLLDEKKGAWSLFFTGSRKNGTWWFFDPSTGERIHYTSFSKAID